MKVLLIILIVLILLFAFILSLSAEATIIYDKGWKTSVQVLFIKKDIELSKLINFILFPDKAGQQAAENKKNKLVRTVSGSTMLRVQSVKCRKGFSNCLCR